MRVPALAVLLAAAIPSAAFAASPAVPAAPRQSIPGAVANAVASSGLRNAAVSVSVRDLQTGQLVVNIEGDRLMVPASNMKVLTTGAALHVLGADFQFRTRMVRGGDRLTVVGDGDPSFGDPTFLGRLTYTDAAGAKRPMTTAEELVDVWVNAARRAGIQKVAELVVDDRIFDRQFTHPEWPADQLDNTYCAQVAGLNFHENLVGAQLGVEGGRPAVTRWEPQAPWLSAATGKATANGKGKQTIAILRTNDPNQFMLSGNLVRPGTEPVPICVRDMPAFFARYVGTRLAAAGIQVGAVRVASPGEAAPGTDLVGPAIPMPLAEVIKRCNEESHNMYAEALLKRIGAARSKQPGSWSNGTAALAAAIDERLGAGTAAKGYAGSDGSGLSRDNRVAPNLVTAWMRSIAIDPKLSQAYLTSLAEGRREGTVKKRFDGLDPEKHQVLCKTGYINGVSCLSGVVGKAGATPRYAFSVMCNDLTKDKNGVGNAKALQDRIAVILAGES